MATALHPGIENDPHHQEAVSLKEEGKRSRNAAMLTTGFWAGVVVALVASAGLVATHFLK
jgi:hypothetical protein